jgi:hypothetical protein
MTTNDGTPDRHARERIFGADEIFDASSIPETIGCELAVA